MRGLNIGGARINYGILRLNTESYPVFGTASYYPLCRLPVFHRDGHVSAVELLLGLRAGFFCVYIVVSHDRETPI